MTSENNNSVKPERIIREILLVSASKFGSKFPQRADHLLSALREIGYDVRPIEAYNFITGVRQVIKQRKVNIKVYTGYRAGIVGLFLSLFGTPMIYDCVENKAMLCDDNWRGAKRLGIPLVDFVEKLMFKRALIVFAAHNTAYIYASKHNARTVLAENGYEESLFDPKRYDRPSLRDRFNVKGPLILFTGKIIPMYAKYLATAIEAMVEVKKQLPNVEFWIYGDGIAKDSLNELVIKLHINVFLKGVVDYEETPKLATIADIGISAYRAESIKMIEWMRMGLPVLAPITDDARIVYSNWTIADLSSMIIKLLKKNERMYKQVRSWKEVARIISSDIEKIINQN